jgi:peptide/nickel transport system substrate-binding protein
MGAHVQDSGLNRRDLLKKGAAGAIALAGAPILAACGGPTSKSNGSSASIPALTPGPPSGGTPVRGGTLRIGLVTNGNAENVDVRKAINTPDYCRTDSLFDPLFFQAPGGTPGGVYPGLAVAAEPNANATTWILHLRDGVTWHDGKPFGADDVVYTIRTWADTASNFEPLASSIIDFKNVRKLGPLTVQVPLLRGVAAFPSITSWYNGYIIQDGTTDFTKPNGTGPFKFKSFTPGTSSTFVVNPNYWKGRPYLDELVVNSSFTDDPSRLNAILSGDIDTAPGVPQALARANSGRMVIGNAAGPGFIAVCMRVNEPPFDDVRVRQALKLLLNRQTFVTDVFSGYATPGNDCVGATLQYWASDIKAAYDPEKAKSLLKAAGHESLTLELLTSPVVPGMVESGTLYAEQAKAVGVTANIRQMSPSVYYSTASPAYATGQRPFSVNYWNAIPPSLAGFYLEALNRHAPFNETSWGFAPGQDTLFYDAMAETDSAKAAEKWHAVQELQATRGGYIIVSNVNYVDAYSTKVRGVETTSAGDNNNFTFSRAWLA